MTQPSVSIVIVNFNGRHLLDACLPAALEQAAPLGGEVIIVDNASTDGSVAHVKLAYPQVVVVKSPRNVGFAAGSNIGVRAATGTTIVLLNNDAVPQPGWLSGLLRALEPADVAVASSVIHEARYPDAYQLGTASISVIGHPIPHVGRDPEHPFYATGCSLAFKKQLFPQPFEPVYFAYYEDTLLSWRAHLQGYRVARALESAVEHVGSATALRQPTVALFFWERNKLLTLLLCYQLSTIWRLVPLYVFDGIARVTEDLWLLLKRPWDLRASAQRYAVLIRALAWLMGHVAQVKELRRAVQSERTCDDRKIVIMLSGKIFDDYVPTRAHAIANRLTVTYCRVVGIRTAEQQ